LADEFKTEEKLTGAVAVGLRENKEFQGRKT